MCIASLPASLSQDLEAIFDKFYEPDMLAFGGPSANTKKVICGLVIVELGRVMDIAQKATDVRKKKAACLRKIVESYLSKPGLEAELKRLDNLEDKARRMRVWKIVAKRDFANIAEMSVLDAKRTDHTMM